MKSATDTDLDAVDAETEKLRKFPLAAHSGNDTHDRLQHLYARRYELQKRQFKALQKKIARMKK